LSENFLFNHGKGNKEEDLAASLAKAEEKVLSPLKAIA
jgi:hypothetical protein